MQAVSGGHFLTVGVFECDIVFCRSVALLRMLYNIRCQPMHPLYGTLPGPYMPGRSHISILVRFLAEEPLRSTGPLCLLISVFLWNDLADPVFDGVGVAVSRA